jgi:tetratricopeptide (TPR) repeat protein/tRNA A-37 threonylcarbamoyl transferase component Bud32
MSSLRPGQSLLHYRVIEKIGQGGMGEVYKAEDLKLGRQTAIKLLPSEAARDQKARQRFLREARSASALNHPHIVTIHSIDAADGLDFIVMEYIEGESLRAKLQRGPAKLEQVLEWGAQVADALEAAHGIGLVHRDIKSANILITSRGQAKVLDFGLAKMMRPMRGGLDTEAATLSGDLTDWGVIVGTVAYMSPEQTRGEMLDPRSDIFSVGVVLYEAATGKLPFSGPSALAIMHEIAAIEAVPPSAVRRELPREFDFVIERALAKNKEQRYRSSSELMAALQALKEAAFERLPILSAEAERESELEAFVGRELEMSRLDEFLRQAVDGSGRVVFLTGEPGIGKTSLADAFLRRARARPTLLLSRGRCVEHYGKGEAYLPFLDAIGALLAGPGSERIATALRTYAPTWCLQLPAVFGSSGALEQLQRETIGATKERMMREMGDALIALAASAPVVLLLEDLHWADPSSVDLLRYLCHRIVRQRVLLLGTFRPEDVELCNPPLKNYRREMQAHKLCEEIALGLLGEEHIDSYLNARFPANDFPPELARLIQRKTEGHPLFATSLVQFLAERGDLTKTNAHWTLARKLSDMDLEAPESVRGMIRKKIDVLGEEDRRALQYASIEGEEFTSTVVAKLLGVDDLALEERLDRLDRVHRLIDPRGEEQWPDGTLGVRYRFAHALYQNVLYGDLVSKRRILLHRQAGEQLITHYGAEASRIATQLAMHFERGRDYARAIEYLIQAGDNAIRVFANAEAEKHYSHALGLVGKLSAEQQTEKYVALFQKRGTVNQALSRFGQAVDDFTQMLNRSRTMGSSALEGAALSALANALFTSHRMGEMQARADEALRLAKASGSEALRVAATVLITLKHMCYGELVEAKRLFDEAIHVARSSKDKHALLQALSYRGFVHFFQSEYNRAGEVFMEGRDLAFELRDGYFLLHCLFGSGIAWANMGRMSEALRTLNEAVEMAQRNGDRYNLPKILNSIGWIHRELQSLDEARRNDQSGAELAHENCVLEAEANSLINLGYDYTIAGEDQKPLAVFGEVEAIFARDDWFRWRYNIRLQAGQAEYWLAQSDLERAEEYARRLVETAAHHGAPKYIAVAHKLLAEVAIERGDLANAEVELNGALDQLREYPALLVAWRTYATLGRLRSQLGDGQAAREAFARALAIIRTIAGNVSDEALRTTFMNSASVRQVLEGCR